MLDNNIAVFCFRCVR